MFGYGCHDGCGSLPAGRQVFIGRDRYYLVRDESGKPDTWPQHLLMNCTIGQRGHAALSQRPARVRRKAEKYIARAVS